MFVVYAISLVVWLMLMDVGAEKSWKTFDISQSRNFLFLLFRCGIAAAVTYFIVAFSHLKGEVNWIGAIMTPFVAMFYYIVYMFFNKKHRENVRDFLKFDRWNAVAMAGCLVIAFCASILR